MAPTPFLSFAEGLKDKQVRIFTVAAEHAVYVGTLTTVNSDSLLIKSGANSNIMQAIRMETIVSIQEIASGPVFSES